MKKRELMKSLDELIKGETLKDPLLLDAALDYVRQVAGALEAARETGIAHSV
jgi:hypothetical protein